MILESGSRSFQSQPPDRGARNVRVSGSAYRAVAFPIVGRGDRTNVVVLESSSEIAAAADRVRSHVFEVGFGFVRVGLTGVVGAVAGEGATAWTAGAFGFGPARVASSPEEEHPAARPRATTSKAMDP